MFNLGYGLTYESNDQLALLSENSGLDNSDIASTGIYFSKGASVPPWDLWLISGELEKQIASFPTSVGGLIVSTVSYTHLTLPTILLV